MILISGWALGQVVNSIDWAKLRDQKALLTLGAVVIFIASLSSALINWNLNRPFQGQELAQLQATSAFLLPAFAAVASAIALVYLLRGWSPLQIRRVFTLTVFAFLLVITGRAAFRAAYIDYDDATEFLVYAHGAPGIKQIIAQASEISQRTVGGLNVALAYDASAPDTGVSWPFVWYLRDFTNQRSFDAPTRALRDSTIVVVDQKNFDKIEPALGNDYYRVDYIRMWWPMQDYFGAVTPRDPSIPFDETYSCKGLLSFFRLFKSHDYSRFCSVFTDPQIRAGVLDIWWNRDYARYAEATGRTDLTLATWQPADQMRLYIRKEVASQIWNYGVGPVQSEAVVDPISTRMEVLSRPGAHSPRAPIRWRPPPAPSMSRGAWRLAPMAPSMLPIPGTIASRSSPRMACRFCSGASSARPKPWMPSMVRAGSLSARMAGYMLRILATNVSLSLNPTALP
jgi:hypothetical protein